MEIPFGQRGAFDSKSLRTTVLSSLSKLLTISHYKKSYNEAIILFLNQTVSRLAIQKNTHILLLFSIFILKLSHRNRFLESTHLLSHCTLIYLILRAFSLSSVWLSWIYTLQWDIASSVWVSVAVCYVKNSWRWDLRTSLLFHILLNLNFGTNLSVLSHENWRDWQRVFHMLPDLQNAIKSGKRI